MDSFPRDHLPGSGVSRSGGTPDGELRPSWGQARLHLFRDDEQTLAILQPPQGPTLFCSREPEPRLDQYFTQWNVLEHHWWASAFNLVGDTLVASEQAPNRYVIGDHNVCGHEDSFITGVFAANRIIHSRRTKDPIPPGPEAGP